MRNNIVVIYPSYFTPEENDIYNNHIKKTIGCKFIIHSYLLTKQFSLTKVYNKAIIDHYNPDKSLVLVFVQNDVIFKTKNWGKKLLHHFNNSHYDILGVAGTKWLGENAIWWEDRDKTYGQVDYKSGIKTWTSDFSKPFSGIEEVVAIDGSFIAVAPDVLVNYFNEDVNGFYFYDIDFCLANYFGGCKIGVISDISLVCKSIFQINQQWEDNRKQVAEKYKSYLPTNVLYKINSLKNFNIKLIDEPKVTIIIPTKNNFYYLRENILAIKNLVRYSNYEIIIADTGSDDNTILKYRDLSYFIPNINSVEKHYPQIRFVYYHYYSFAKINNDVVKNHVSDDTELILFCNDDVKLLNDAVSRCVEIYQKNKDTVGTIGIRLHYGDNSVQHNGIIAVNFKEEKLDFTHVDLKRTKEYQTIVNYKSIGNTGAFLMINKILFEKIGYFNENYIECYEDVELNFECLIRGKKNITVSDAVAYHFESISRDRSENKSENLNHDYNNNLYPFYEINKSRLDEYFNK